MEELTGDEWLLNYIDKNHKPIQPSPEPGEVILLPMDKVQEEAVRQAFVKWCVDIERVKYFQDTGFLPGR